MARVTSKLQVTIPKSLAKQLRIKPGDEIEWSAAADSIRINRARGAAPATHSIQDRLRFFDQATARQRRRQRSTAARAQSGSRGWTRETLYERGRSR